MKARDLVVGRDYYYERSLARFTRAASRDFDNRSGRHLVTILERTLYRRDADTRYYSPAGAGERGTHVRVRFAGSIDPFSVPAQFRVDREGYVALGSIRGEWEVATNEARGEMAVRREREREREQRRARYRDELTSLVNRARNYGLMVSAPSMLPNREGTANFYVNETNLALFLDALDEATRELSATSTGGTT